MSEADSRADKKINFLCWLILLTLPSQTSIQGTLAKLYPLNIEVLPYLQVLSQLMMCNFWCA